MAGTVAKKTADVHSINSKKTDIQHVENLFKKIYDFLLGILETMWKTRDILFLVLLWLAVWSLSSYFTFLCLHVLFSPLSLLFRISGFQKSLYYTFEACTMKLLQYK